MSFTVTNQKYSQALRGQGVKVTLSPSDAALYLDTIEVGDECTADSSDKGGTVRSVDRLGNSFKISPKQPNDTFNSLSTPGYLASGEVISVLQGGGVDFIIAEDGSFLITEASDFLITE